MIESADAGNNPRRRTREEIRAGYRLPTNQPPAAPPQAPAPVAAAPPQPLSAPPQARPQLQPQPQPQPQPLPRVQPIPKTEPAAVSINIQLPSLNLKQRSKKVRAAAAKPLAAAYRHRRMSLAVIGGLVVIGGASAGLTAYQHRQTTSQGSVSGSAGGGEVASRAVAAEPTFTPVAPATKPQLGKVGSQSAFDGNHNVYSYIDSINKQRVTVSEQQPGASGASAAAETASKSLNANKVVSTNAGDIYINTNTKYGSQTVVASVKNLLIFMQSSQVLGDSDWKTYVESLQ